MAASADAEAVVAGVHDAMALVVSAATAALAVKADAEDALEAAEAVEPVAGVARKGGSFLPTSSQPSHILSCSS